MRSEMNTLSMPVSKPGGPLTDLVTWRPRTLDAWQTEDDLQTCLLGA